MKFKSDQCESCGVLHKVRKLMDCYICNRHVCSACVTYDNLRDLYTCPICESVKEKYMDKIYNEEVRHETKIEKIKQQWETKSLRTKTVKTKENEQ